MQPCNKLRRWTQDRRHDSKQPQRCVRSRQRDQAGMKVQPRDRSCFMKQMCYNFSGRSCVVSAIQAFLVRMEDQAWRNIVFLG